ncbi:ATP-dependent RNA helicase vasa [Culicoides brevitarsis]|uniref:ATP-dependent RNA helicase vasa n=1 Tax=Culicoides brevitarsis TaxID=469753 RepID=UPI00307B7E2F
MDDEWDDGPVATPSYNNNNNGYAAPRQEESREFGRRDNNYGGGSEDRPKREPRAGDWSCSECNQSNFARNNDCFKCHAAKPEGAGGNDGGNSYGDRPKREPRAGDWNCPDCNQSNFARNNECFKCQTPKPEGAGNDGGDGGYGGDRPKREPRAGDWTCSECSQSNFGSRSECFKCQAAKPEGAGGDDRPKREPSKWDWNCPNSECGVNNFGNRNECFKCQTAKPESANFDENGEKRPELYIPEEPTTNEEEIFNTNIASSADFFDKQDKIQVSVSENAPKPILSFEQSGLREYLLENVRKSGYTRPTPIQKYGIPTIMAGRDMMACAQTGSGKTAGFLLPILHTLLSDERPLEIGKPHAVVVSPTRELAIQIFNECRKFSYGSIIKVEIAYGGTGTRYQSEKILRGAHIIVATPGRLLDFVDKGWIQFDNIRFVVLDEADRMLDMGFMEPMKKMMHHPTMTKPGERQTLMFSATFPEDVQRIAGEFLNDYVFVAVGIVGGACADVVQTIVPAGRTEKRNKLMEILEQEDPHMVMVFVETTRMADFLATFMSNTRFPTTSIHGKREQRERELALKQFRSGAMKVLVTTSVCARGLDIKNVSHVINYDLPKTIDDYVHRIGRTGRLGNRGKATSLYDEETDRALVPDLLRILQQSGQEIPPFLSGQASAGGDAGLGYGAVDIRPGGTAQLKQLEDDDDW